MSSTILSKSFADSVKVLDILNYCIATSSSVAKLKLATLEEVNALILTLHRERYPLVVATQHEDKAMVGFAYFRPLPSSGHAGQRYTVTTSVFVAFDARRRGIGSELVYRLRTHRYTDRRSLYCTLRVHTFLEMLTLLTLCVVHVSETDKTAVLFAKHLKYRQSVLSVPDLLIRCDCS